MRRAALILLIVAAGLPLVASPPAAALPAGFQVTTVIKGLDTPTALRFASDGRVFVAEKSGLIKVFDDLADTTPTVFADLSTNVYNYLDRGLLGIELHPSFPTVPYVYALYTHDADIGGAAPKWGTPGVLSDPCPDPPGAMTHGCVVSARLTRLEAAGDAMTGAEQVLVEDWCQQFPSHSIGTITFGPDGALYAGAGDGAKGSDWGQYGDPVNPCGDPPGGAMEPPTAEGGALRSQDLRTAGDPVTLDGAIIRVDPQTGEALPGNPLAAQTDPNARRIVAYGLRNPFRFAFRPGTNQIFLGDVGESRVEEINVVADVADAVVENFGWPCYQGSPRHGPFDSRDFTICEEMYGTRATTAPFFEYGHSHPVYSGDPCKTGSGVVSAIGFYEGGDYPDSYDGALFFADYVRQCIWVMFEDQNGQIDPNTAQAFVSSDTGYPVDLQVGPNGDLFYVDIGIGRIRRIQYFSTNQPPTAHISATPTSGPAPLEVSFDGTTSTDPEGAALAYEWDLDGDGAFDDSTEAQPTYVYGSEGDYTASLRVTDPEGAQGTASVLISAGNNPPAPVILAPGADFTWHVGEEIVFSGEASDPEDGVLPASALDWSVILHHCPDECHAHPLQDFVGQASGSFPASDHEYPSHLELRLTATDSGGLAVTTNLLLAPETVGLTFDSNPAGLELVVGALAATTPFTATAIVGSSNPVTAPSPQTLDGSPYEFSSWSDGGARSHDVVAPADPETYVATFNLADFIDVSITDKGYSPRNLTGSLPQNIRWTNDGVNSHTVTDNSGMELYDSGILAPGDRFTYRFFAAGRYSFRSSVDDRMTGSVSIPMTVSPSTGLTSTTFDLTWASESPPDGMVFDIQIQRPGTTSWVYWRHGVTVTTAGFVPDAGTGTYSFRSRLRRTSDGRASAYSVPLSITVS